MESYDFKIASEDWEFQQIHKLNYETFVEEIPQHDPDFSKELVDKFHDQNTYIICVDGSELLGMIAIRDKRPFSLDDKLSNLDEYLPASNSMCEMRLLSIKKEKRRKKIIKGLFESLAKFCENRDYDLALVSATTSQDRLYRTLGFKPFGPLVGSNGAIFQPMYLTPDSYLKFKENSKLLNELKRRKHMFLPGPVAVREEVKDEFLKEPLSHRSQEFVDDLKRTQSMLSGLTNAKHAQILMGSGTLANDVVAAQLALLDNKGLILSNGEFGNRLVDHALRFSLDFELLKKGWGEIFSITEIEKQIKESKINWLWFVHCETSTGVLNDLEGLKKLGDETGFKLCVDCVSSIGTIQLDLNEVYFASGASGKGLASYPGLCFVFYNHAILPKPGSIPRYFDLGYYQVSKGVPFTISSNLLYSLKKSLEIIDVGKKYSDTKRDIEWLSDELMRLDLKVISKKQFGSPALITFEMPEGLSSEDVGKELEKQEFYLSYKSEYLIKRNLMQIALMGNYSKLSLRSLIKQLDRVIN